MAPSSRKDRRAAPTAASIGAALPERATRVRTFCCTGPVIGEAAGERNRVRAAVRVAFLRRRATVCLAPVSRAAPYPVLLSVVLVAAALLPGSAAASCDDRARPGVDWRHCVLAAGDLAGADLKGAVLRDASFERANLAGADLSGADAYRAKLVSADLTGAKLDGANFAEADFTRADLTGASLKGADLRRARFFRAKLRGADLSNAQMRGADLLGSDLSDALWIDGKRRCGEGSIGQCN
jgi:uncharacterized protein YjbI with pentapeptide repeats